MPLELIFMGTGTSAGVPMIGCRCDVCRSADPRDQRTRPSVLVRYPDPRKRHEDGTPLPRQFLIDTSPEMRTQAIRHDLDRLDGVLYTHAHADHIFGLDDLRRFNATMDAPIDVYAEARTLETMRAMFRYVFEAHSNANPSFVATLLPRVVEAGKPLELHGATWTPVRLLHGRLPIVGFRVDYLALAPAPGGRTESGVAQDRSEAAPGSRASLAYCTDVSSIPPESYPLLADLDVLVIDALRYRHHPTHFNVDQALEVIDRLQPRRAYLTHIAHDISHADLEPRLPEGVRIAFDGLVIDCAAGPVDERAQRGEGAGPPASPSFQGEQRGS